MSKLIGFRSMKALAFKQDQEKAVFEECRINLQFIYFLISNSNNKLQKFLK